MVSIEFYQIDVTTGQFQFLDTIEMFSNLRWGNRLNRLGGASFQMSLYDKKATLTNLRTYGTTVVIKSDLNPPWVGYIDSYRATIGEGDDSVQVQCISYGGHLTSRYIYGEYIRKGIQAADIAWELINTVQSRTNGHLGIQQGTAEMIGVINETLENAEVLQALMNQSDNINGYDFEFVPILDGDGRLTQVNFNLRKRLGTVRNDLPALNIDNVESLRVETASPKINFVHGRSYGTGESVLFSDSVEEFVMLSNTRREFLIKYNDIKIQSTLDGKVQQFLLDNGGDQFLFRFSIRPEAIHSRSLLSIGDTISLDFLVENTLIDFTTTGRVVELEYQLDDTGTFSITPTLDFSK